MMIVAHPLNSEYYEFQLLKFSRTGSRMINRLHGLLQYNLYRDFAALSIALESWRAPSHYSCNTEIIYRCKLYHTWLDEKQFNKHLCIGSCWRSPTRIVLIAKDFCCMMHMAVWLACCNCSLFHYRFDYLTHFIWSYYLVSFNLDQFNGSHFKSSVLFNNVQAFMVPQVD